MEPVKSLSWDSPLIGPATQVAYSCANCRRYSVALAPGASGHADNVNVNDRKIGTASQVAWVPRIGDAVEYPDVPAHISSAASEAHECFSIGAKKAAILMARSVIEASAKEQGVTSGTLYSKIEALVKKGIVRPLIAEAAHGVRDFGNDMAHGDFDVEVTDDDVNDVLNLMSVVLSEVFQVDAKTRSLRERVSARKATKTSESPE